MTAMGPSVTERRNSFDAIRLAAALFVMVSHQIGMAGWPEPPLGPLGITLASTGLYIFFALSGYLVCQSWLRRSDWRSFVTARVLRIYPAYLVNIAFCVALGAAITSLPRSLYWGAAETWRFIGLNAPILTTPTQFTLPGVLTEARWPIVNGSIWTIKYEVVCYLALLAFMTLTGPGRSRPRMVLLPALALVGAAYIAWISLVPNPQGLAFFEGYNTFNLLRFTLTFGAGALYALAEPLSERARLAALAIPSALILLGPSPEVARCGIILLLVVFVIEVGKSTLLHGRVYERIGDLSYGVFLYAYPVQNVLMTRLFDGTNFALVLGLSLLVTFGLAALSWRLVEKPALALKGQRLVTHPALRTAPDA